MHALIFYQAENRAAYGACGNGTMLFQTAACSFANGLHGLSPGSRGQSLYDVGMLRVDIRGKGAVSITFAKQVVRQEKPDLIESGGIKHAADEAGRLYRKE